MEVDEPASGAASNMSLLQSLPNDLLKYLVTYISPHDVGNLLYTGNRSLCSRLIEKNIVPTVHIDVQNMRRNAFVFAASADGPSYCQRMVYLLKKLNFLENLVLDFSNATNNTRRFNADEIDCEQFILRLMDILSPSSCQTLRSLLIYSGSLNWWVQLKSARLIEVFGYIPSYMIPTESQESSGSGFARFTSQNLSNYHYTYNIGMKFPNLERLEMKSEKEMRNSPVDFGTPSGRWRSNPERSFAPCMVHLPSTLTSLELPIDILCEEYDEAIAGLPPNLTCLSLLQSVERSPAYLMYPEVQEIALRCPKLVRLVLPIPGDLSAQEPEANSAATSAGTLGPNGGFLNPQNPMNNNAGMFGSNRGSRSPPSRSGVFGNRANDNFGSTNPRNNNVGRFGSNNAPSNSGVFRTPANNNFGNFGSTNPGNNNGGMFGSNNAPSNFGVFGTPANNNNNFGNFGSTNPRNNYVDMFGSNNAPSNSGVFGNPSSGSAELDLASPHFPFDLFPKLTDLQLILVSLKMFEPPTYTISFPGHMKSLELSHSCPLADWIFPQLSNCHSLESVTVGSQISFNYGSLQYLPPSVTHLDLAQSQSSRGTITQPTFEVTIKHMPKNLTTLHWAHHSLDESQLYLLPPTIKELKLIHTHLNENTVPHLPARLENLLIPVSVFTPKIIGKLPKMIKKVHFSGNRWTDVDLYHLENLRTPKIEVTITNGVRVTGALIPSSKDNIHIDYSKLLELTKSNFLPANRTNLLIEETPAPGLLPTTVQASDQLRFPSSTTSLHLLNPEIRFFGSPPTRSIFNLEVVLPLPVGLRTLFIDTAQNMTDSDISSFPETIQHLYLKPFIITSATWKLLPKGLITLGLTEAIPTEGSLSDSLVDLPPQLTSLLISSHQIDDKCLAHLPNGLTNLCLTNVEISPDNYQLLPRSLTSLFIPDSSITTDYASKALPRSITNLGIRDLTAAAAEFLPNIERLVSTGSVECMSLSVIPKTLMHLVVTSIELKLSILDLLEQDDPIRQTLSMNSLRKAVARLILTNFVDQSKNHTESANSERIAISNLYSVFDLRTESNFMLPFELEKVNQQRAATRRFNQFDEVKTLPNILLKLDLNESNMKDIPPYVTSVEFRQLRASWFSPSSSQPLTLGTPVEPNLNKFQPAPSGFGSNPTPQLMTVDFTTLPPNVTTLIVQVNLRVEDFLTLPPTVTSLGCPVSDINIWKHIPKSVIRFETMGDLNLDGIEQLVGDHVSSVTPFAWTALIPDHLIELTILGTQPSGRSFSNAKKVVNAPGALLSKLPSSLEILRMPNQTLDDESILFLPRTIKFLGLHELMLTELSVKAEVPDIQIPKFQFKEIAQNDSAPFGSAVFPHDYNLSKRQGKHNHLESRPELLSYKVEFPDCFPEIQATFISFSPPRVPNTLRFNR